MRNSRLAIAETSDEVRRCYPVMRELRTHLASEEEFLERVALQQEQGYQLAFLESDGQVRAVAGYRFLESLFSGKNLYVDDLVTRDADRSHGYGGQLLDWLIEQARANKCETLELDSGVQRFDAHRFYFSKRMSISSYHFRIKLEPNA
jgi:GNAT superfamily N-acetyltransferase